MYDPIDQAIRREKQIKGWSRAKKNALIASMNPEWNDLASDWYPEPLVPASGGSEGAPPDTPWMGGIPRFARDDRRSR